MSISKSLMEYAGKNRELLMKLLPIGLLRTVKRTMIKSNLRKVAKHGIPKFEPERFARGINLLGDTKAEIGLGQSARLLAAELEASDVPFTIYHVPMDGNLRANDTSFDDKITNTLPYGINLFHLNPYELGVAYSELGKETWEHHYNIAFWLWELEDFPKEWEPCFPLVDEVWTPSEFTSSSVRKAVGNRIKVRTIPYHVSAPVKEAYDRTYFNLPKNQVLFLSMYDCNSTIDRKNPTGVIEAFKKAFPKEQENVGLVLKVNNATEEDLAVLKETMGQYENVYYITNVMSKLEVNSLIACVDVFVSLHRAEGFGLVMAEAMLNKTACIATNWSSNTEFMNERVACMVPASLVTITKGNDQYKKGYRWAEPDVTKAAEYMKQLANDEEYRNRLTRDAKSYIDEKLGMARAVELINHRVKAIYEEHK